MVGENWQMDSATVLADCNCGLAAKKRKRRKKKTRFRTKPRTELFSSSPTFDLSFPFHVLLRLLRFFAAKKASRIANNGPRLATGRANVRTLSIAGDEIQPL